MDPTDLIKGMTDFLDTHYKKELLKRVSEGEENLVVSFVTLTEFDPALAKELLDNPVEVIKAAELVISELELGKPVKRIRVRFSELPASAEVPIREIRAEHLGKFIIIKGLVRQKSDVRPEVVSTKYECPTCGKIIPLLQLEATFREPNRCSCGRKGMFTLISKELIDVQMLTLEEAPEDLEGGEQPKRMKVLLKGDLVSPLSERRTNPGSKIQVTGLTQEHHIMEHGVKLKRFDLIFEANNFQPMEEDYTRIRTSEAEEAKIHDLAKDPQIYERLAESLAPTIFGYEEVKAALILQLFGGVHKERDAGVKSRGDIHVLLVGDPGAGKSILLQSAKAIAPKSRYVSGTGASGVGLTASVVKDEFLKGYSLEAGALVLCHKGLCCIDEFDKMREEDRGTIHEALEQQTVSIAKANIQATLLARTTVLAAANPKLGRFDDNKTLVQQIELEPPLLSRFDLIFPIRDIPNPQKDQKMAQFILELHQNKNQKPPQLDPPFLKKYISYAKNMINPMLTDEAVREIEEFYVSLRNTVQSEDTRSVPITPRQLEGLVRLAEASARIQLRKKVTKKDAQRAIVLLRYCLDKVGRDPKTGILDIDRLSAGVSATQRSKLRVVQEIIDELTEQGKKSVEIEKIVEAGKEKGLSSSDVEETIEQLKRHGEIFEPRRGNIQKL